ncbi:hypothetical protein B0H10DRAFT_2210259 [Mycena sp. CBHHK59/15]|nr:hypothetical protein B0H10DRAFT_2210259 [Mycena sp. CBHHK59/15]
MSKCRVLDNRDQEADAESNQQYKVTEWTGREDGDKNQPADLILLHLKPTYEKPFANRGPSPSRRVCNTKSTGGDVDMEITEKNVVPARKVGDTYSPNLPSDHKGPYFAHDKAKLVQRHYKDEDGNLIAPHKLYEKLTEGTLFLAQISLATYVIKEKNPKWNDSKECLANCIFAGLPAAANCDPNADAPDVACFCASSAYTSNVTQCASATCSICTTGACNITADPLTDQCNSAAPSGSVPASASKTSAAPSGSGSGSATSAGSGSGSATSAGSGSGSATPAGSGSTTPNSVSTKFNAERVKGVTIFTAGLEDVDAAPDKVLEAHYKRAMLNMKSVRHRAPPPSPILLTPSPPHPHTRPSSILQARRETSRLQTALPCLHHPSTHTSEHVCVSPTQSPVHANSPNPSPSPSASYTPDGRGWQQGVQGGRHRLE